MNNEDHNICREGIVRVVNGDEITVEVIVSSACSGCHAKSICIPSDRRQERIVVKNTRNEQYEIGETVELLLETSAGNKAVVLAYVLPLFVLLVERWNQCARGDYLLPYPQIRRQKGGAGDYVWHSEERLEG